MRGFSQNKLKSTTNRSDLSASDMKQKENYIDQVETNPDFLNHKPDQFRLMEDNRWLTKQLQFVNNLNDRLGKELSICQALLGIYPNEKKYQELVNQTSPEIQSINVPIYHQVDIPCLAPLLLAYEDTISKQSKLIDEQKKDLFVMEKHVDELIKENDILCKSLQEKSQKILNLYENNKFQNQLEFDDKKERHDLLVEENNELHSKFTELQAKFNQLSSQQEKRQSDVNDYKRENADFLQNNHKLEIENQSLKKQVQKLNEQVKQLEIQNQILEDNSILHDQLIKQKEYDNKMQFNQIQNLKRINQDKEDFQKNELERLTIENDSFRVAQAEHDNRLVQLERLNNELQANDSELRNQILQQKQELDENQYTIKKNQNAISQHENQINLLNESIKDTRKQLTEAKVKSDSALLDSEQFSRQLQSLNDKHKDEIQFIQGRFQNELQNQEKKYKEMLSNREEEIYLLNDELSAYQNKNEKLTRENKNLSEDLDSTNTTIVGDYVNRIQELKCKLDESNDLFKDQLSQKTSLLELELKASKEEVLYLKEENQLFSKQNSTLSSENNSYRLKLDRAVKDKNLLLNEFVNIKKKLQTGFEIEKGPFIIF